MIENIIKRLERISLNESAKTRGLQNTKNDFEDEVNYIISQFFNKLYSKNELVDKFGSFNKNTIKPGQKVGIPDGYISQPFGSQNPPDFIIFYSGVAYFIECKSVKTGAPAWNTRYPSGLTIYLFHNRGLNETTYFLGKDIVIDDLINTFNRQQKELNDLLKKHEKELSDKSINPFGFYNYGRNMWVQKKSLGGGEDFIIDLFGYDERRRLELNVIAFINKNRED